ncbi:MAG: DUF4407 domain-containing protein [Xanthobacteraceae bacterium]|nr:DUF4407 domain-containing protein [Xanthobacteraceae bacterium]
MHDSREADRAFSGASALMLVTFVFSYAFVIDYYGMVGFIVGWFPSALLSFLVGLVAFTYPRFINSVLLAFSFIPWS